MTRHAWTNYTSCPWHQTWCDKSWSSIFSGQKSPQFFGTVNVWEEKGDKERDLLHSWGSPKWSGSLKGTYPPPYTMFDWRFKISDRTLIHINQIVIAHPEFLSCRWLEVQLVQCINWNVDSLMLLSRVSSTNCLVCPCPSAPCYCVCLHWDVHFYSFRVQKHHISDTLTGPAPQLLTADGLGPWPNLQGCPQHT